MKYFKKQLSGNFIFLFLFLFTGCYSYKNISSDDYFKENEHSSTKIIGKNKSEILINPPDSLLISEKGNQFIIRRSKVDSVIQKEDIGWIREYKFDYISSCIAGVLSGVTGIVVILAIVGVAILVLWGPIKF